MELDVLWVVVADDFFGGELFSDVFEFDVAVGVEVGLAHLCDM